MATKTAEKKLTLAQRVARLEQRADLGGDARCGAEPPSPAVSFSACFNDPMWVRTVVPCQGGGNSHRVVARKTCAECGWQTGQTFNLSRRGERKAFLAFLRG